MTGSMAGSDQSRAVCVGGVLSPGRHWDQGTLLALQGVGGQLPVFCCLRRDEALSGHCHPVLDPGWQTKVFSPLIPKALSLIVKNFPDSLDAASTTSLVLAHE